MSSAWGWGAAGKQDGGYWSKFSTIIHSFQNIMSVTHAVGPKWDVNPNEFWEANPESNFAPSKNTCYVRKYRLRNLVNITEEGIDFDIEDTESSESIEVLHTDNLETASYWVTENVLKLKPTPVLGFDIEWR